MLLEFKDVDFDYIKEIINRTIVNIIQLSSMINNQVDDSSKINASLFLKSIIKNDEEVYNRFLDNLYNKAKEVKIDKKAEETLAIKFTMCFHCANNLYLLTNMDNRNDLRDAVTSVFNIMDINGEIKSLYLFRDKNTKIIYNNMDFICDTKLILNKVKKIARECCEMQVNRVNNIIYK